jgi:RNA 2',3'-cyclic 3'-phosphodiesterase
LPPASLERLTVLASWRLFLAVPVPRPVEERLEEILRKVSGFREVKWIGKEQLHITLRFIGNIDENSVPQLEGRVREAVSGFTPFESEIDGLGAFPNLNRPRVLFLPVVRGEESYRGLEISVSLALEGMGLKPEEREYHPHLTLGRVRGNQDARAAVNFLLSLLPAKVGPWKMDRLILFKSQLTSEGPVYTKLEEFELKGTK